MSDKTRPASRRTVLKLTGATLASVAGSGVVSANHEHPAVETGSFMMNPDGTATLNGDVTEFGQGANSVDAWFEYKERYSNIVTETPKQTLYSTGTYSERTYSLADNHDYEFRAVVQDNDDGDTAYGDWVMFRYLTPK